jgi:hypothetical protein
MEGKLKEKLESTGIAFLCMGIGKFNSNSIINGCNMSLICISLKYLNKSS